MHRSDIPTRLSLALLLLILIHPAPNVHAAGAPADAETPASSITSPASLPETGYFYTVQPYDTLWDIAVAHGISVDTLIAANAQVDPMRLQAGQTIFVRAAPALVPRKPTPRAPTPPSTPVPEATAALAAESDQPPPANAPLPLSEPAPADLPTATPVAAPTPEPTPADPPAPAGWPAEMLALINAQRAAQGLAALAWSPELARAAQAHAEDCAQRNQGSHVGSDGAKLAARLARVDYGARASSENWANAQSVQHAFGMWWNEPSGRDPHRRNILGARYREIGIGVAKGPWGYYFVADFGSR